MINESKAALNLLPNIAIMIMARRGAIPITIAIKQPHPKNMFLSFYLKNQNNLSLHSRVNFTGKTLNEAKISCPTNTLF
jgi:hypothetical protein